MPKADLIEQGMQESFNRGVRWAEFMDTEQSRKAEANNKKLAKLIKAHDQPRQEHIIRTRHTSPDIFKLIRELIQAKATCSGRFSMKDGGVGDLVIEEKERS